MDVTAKYYSDNILSVESAIAPGMLRCNSEGYREANSEY